MPQTSGFRSAKQILVVSFATQARAFILSDRNIFYTPGGGGGGEQRRGLMPLGLFLFSSYFTANFSQDNQLSNRTCPLLSSILVTISTSAKRFERAVIKQSPFENG